MSEYLRAAREKLRSAVSDLDARIAELHAEADELIVHRSLLVTLIDGPEAVGADTRGGRHEVAATVPAARPVSPPAPNSEVAERVLAAVAKHAPVTFSEIEAAGRLTNATATKRLITTLIATGQLVRTGKTARTRYSLPSSGRPQPDSEGDRTPVSQRGLSSQRTARAAAQPNVLDSRPRHASRG